MLVAALSLVACGPAQETTVPDAQAEGSAEAAPSAPSPEFTLVSDAWDDGGAIPPANAFCIPADEGHVGLGTNINPDLRWTAAPEGTRSFAIVMTDPDVPSKMDDLNQEGKTIPKDLERMTFVHWVLIDIPATSTGIAAGADSDAITPKGKTPGPTSNGNRGVNDYTKWFANDESMAGNYGGYDGPCPPWNDERVHHYTTTIYALDVDVLEVGENFSLDAVTAAMKGHILGEASLTGQYSLNPAVTVPASE